MAHNRFDTRKSLLCAVFLLFVAGCGGPSAPAVSDEHAVQTMVASTLQAYQTPTLSASATPLPPTAPLPTLTLSPTLTSIPQGPIVRIQFLAGATQTFVTGQIQPGQTIGYAVQAAENQPMIAMLSSTNQDATLSIRGANGTALLPQAAGLANWQGLVPSTQDYFIDIRGGSAAQTFTLNLTIVARVQFAVGETRTVLRGVTVGGYPVSYVVYARQGQKMDVLLNVPADTAALSIWGFDDGQPYARSQSETVDFSLNLPATQDYIIEVVPKAGAAVEYNMSVRIK